MNATERARRSDALYYDNISRRELCDMIAHLESDLAESKAENAKLRELVEYMHRCFVRGHDWGPYCAGETVCVEQRMRELGIEEGA